MAKISVEEARQFRVGEDFQLADVDPASTPGLDGNDEIEDAFDSYDEDLEDLQEMLYANGRAGNVDTGSVLLVLQGMDTSGKGGIVRHVIGSTMDLQGVRIHAFGPPTEEERQHDFLWRFDPHVPEPGMVGVFDRSHYEDVLVQRVKQLADPEEIERRYGAIVQWERGLVQRGVRIIKIMPHISREFQAENLKERILREDKHWKYNPGDIDDRKLWSQYMAAYQIAMTRTSTDEAPWYCIPSDNKDYCRTVVKTLVYDALKSLDLSWPEADFDADAELERLARS